MPGNLLMDVDDVKQKLNPGSENAILQSFRTTTPFEIVGIDITGPYQQTRNGN